MNRFVRALVLLLGVAVVGCGDTAPTPVPTDPDSVRKLEELQKQGGRGEGGKSEGGKGDKK